MPNFIESILEAPETIKYILLFQDVIQSW